MGGPLVNAIQPRPIQPRQIPVLETRLKVERGQDLTRIDRIVGFVLSRHPFFPGLIQRVVT